MCNRFWIGRPELPRANARSLIAMNEMSHAPVMSLAEMFRPPVMPYFAVQSVVSSADERDAFV
jgi:hypothetical protein